LKLTDDPISCPPLDATLGPVPLAFALPLVVLLPFNVGNVILILPPPALILGIPPPPPVPTIIEVILVIAVTVGSIGMLTGGIVDMEVVIDFGIDVAMEEVMDSAMEIGITVVAEAEESMGMLVPMSGRRFREAAGRTSKARGTAAGEFVSKVLGGKMVLWKKKGSRGHGIESHLQVSCAKAIVKTLSSARLLLVYIVKLLFSEKLCWKSCNR
jgi:hypothetical protein